MTEKLPAGGSSSPKMKSKTPPTRRIRRRSTFETAEDENGERLRYVMVRVDDQTENVVEKWAEKQRLRSLPHE